MWKMWTTATGFQCCSWFSLWRVNVPPLAPLAGWEELTDHCIALPWFVSDHHRLVLNAQSYKWTDEIMITIIKYFHFLSNWKFDSVFLGVNNVNAAPILGSKWLQSPQPVVLWQNIAKYISAAAATGKHSGSFSFRGKYILYMVLYIVQGVFF